MSMLPGGLPPVVYGIMGLRGGPAMVRFLGYAVLRSLYVLLALGAIGAAPSGNSPSSRCRFRSRSSSIPGWGSGVERPAERLEQASAG